MSDADPGGALAGQNGPGPKGEAQVLAELNSSLDALGRPGARLKPRDYLGLLQRYRLACTVLARREQEARSPAELAHLRALVGRAHGVLFSNLGRSTESLLRRLVTFFMVDCPRAIRAEWRLIGGSLGVLYALAGLAFWAVARDFELAYSLLDPEMVAREVEQLEAAAEGEPFIGNFSFGAREAPSTAGFLMFHNARVSMLFFASSLIPPLYLLVLGTNALMLGTYTAVAWHWGQAGSISSILWCHGTLEIQAIVLAGAAGLILVRALLLPGPWSRGTSLRRSVWRAWCLLAPVFPMLFLAGNIEAFVSPPGGAVSQLVASLLGEEAVLPMRLTVAVTSGLGLLAWILFADRLFAPRRGERTPRSARSAPA